MNAHALAVLEFARVVEGVAQHAVTESGADLVRALVPLHDQSEVELAHERVAAVRALRASDRGWDVQRVPRLGRIASVLRVLGAAWTPAEARDAMVLLGSSARTRAALAEPGRPEHAVAALAPLRDRLLDAPQLARVLARAVDDDGLVRDDASPALRRLRRELRGAESALVKLLEAAMHRLSPHQRVPDASVTVRNGRYVIPVRREARTAVGGIVHDTSASGATLFVEPPAGVEAANRIRELEIDERREVERILLEITDAARPVADELEATHGALAELDSLHARAVFADATDCAPVSFAAPSDTLVLRRARHPLLVSQGLDVVPFDLEMTGAQRTLLVSGPNTGGKTVLLKAVGLFHCMAQAGIPVPVGAGSVLTMVDDVFADIGDEQSIEASLSTFSAHLVNLREILASATARSLVLIDELGSGTDPMEGAALGAAILEELTLRGVRCVATTHLGALKDLPLSVPGIVNASLQFDEAALAPTYRLLLGLPGRSFGLSIARRLSLPESVLARAEERVPRQERLAAALLASLEEREAALDAREATLRADEAETSARGRRVADREAAVRAREREAERTARTEARRFLLDARAEVERSVNTLRALAAEGDAARAAREARRTLETRAGEHAKAIAALDAATPAATGIVASESSSGAAVAVGASVAVATLGGKIGRVLELRGADALVAVGAVKLTVPRAALAGVTGGGPREVASGAGSIPETSARTEVDVRGLRAGEVDDRILAAVDAAVCADLRTLRIIHGKGTGALRARVTELLRDDPRVRGQRPGAWNEGGAGVTVVEFA